MSFKETFIEVLVAINYPNLEEVNCYNPDEIDKTVNKNEKNSPLFNRDEIESEISRLELFKKQDESEDFDLAKDFEDAVSLIGSGLVEKKVSKRIENLFDNDIFSHNEINPFVEELVIAGLISALKLGLQIGRIEAKNGAIGLVYKNHTIMKEKFTEDEFVKMSSSAIGSRKNLKQREASHLYLSKVLDDTPNISINKMAKTLNLESKSNRIEFSREVPISTAKDYARQVKKRNEDQ
jgi:hypothetical protein